CSSTQATSKNIAPVLRMKKSTGLYVNSFSMAYNNSANTIGSICSAFSTCLFSLYNSNTFITFYLYLYFNLISYSSDNLNYLLFYATTIIGTIFLIYATYLFA